MNETPWGPGQRRYSPPDPEARRATLAWLDRLAVEVALRERVTPKRSE